MRRSSFRSSELSSPIKPFGQELDEPRWHDMHRRAERSFGPPHDGHYNLRPWWSSTVAISSAPHGGLSSRPDPGKSSQAVGASSPGLGVRVSTPAGFASLQDFSYVLCIAWQLGIYPQAPRVDQTPNRGQRWDRLRIR